MNIKLKLPIYHTNADTEQAELVHNDYAITDCDIKTHIFYNITSIAPSRCKVCNVRYTTIYAGGDVFACTLTMAQVEELIDNNLNT